jgi:hypothetical protein
MPDDSAEAAAMARTSLRIRSMNSSLVRTVPKTLLRCRTKLLVSIFYAMCLINNCATARR